MTDVQTRVSTSSPGSEIVRAPRATTPLVRATVHDAGETQWWFDARDIDDERLLRAVERSNCTHLVLDYERHRQVATDKQKVVYLEHEQQLEALEPEAWVFTPSEALRARATASGRKAGLFVDVEDLEREFPRCVELCERGDDFVVIDIEHATYIPYELLLAKAEGKPTRVLRSVPIKGLESRVDPVHQSLNAFATMERGIGVLFKSRSVEAVENLSRQLAQRQSGRVQLLPATVQSVQHTGLGHRACIDLTAMMTAEEGMLIGSTGWGGLFVCSETHYLPHMNLRPFRVNAGGIHSYVWGPGNNVVYLSELKAGSEVLCVDRHGNSRVVTVGRAKIERRPLLKIRCSIALRDVAPEVRSAVEASYLAQQQVTPDGEALSPEDLECVYVNAFLQNDWHVRVMGADGKVRHTTLVKPGDQLLAHVELPGRHTGLKVTEHIFEQ